MCPLYKAMLAPNACVLVNRNGRDLLIIQSPSLQKTIPFDQVGPLDVLNYLRDAGLELMMEEHDAKI